MKKVIYLLLAVVILVACDKDSDDFNKTPQTEQKQQNLGDDRYVVMTYEKLTIPAGHMKGKVMMNSYITYFPKMPTGDNISNIVPYNTLKGHIGSNGGSLMQSGNNLYRVSNSAAMPIGQLSANWFYNTPTKLEFEEQGGLVREIIYKDLDTPEISVKGKNFTISNGRGFICMDEDKIPTIMNFDPNTMSKLSSKVTLKKKLSKYSDDEALDIIYQKVEELSPEIAGIELDKAYVGMNFCKWHNGKLLVDIYFGDTYPDAYILAIDFEGTGTWEAVSAIKEAKLIGSYSETSQSANAQNGDLYIVSRGSDNVGFYRNSKISRIKSDAITVDDTWELDIKEVAPTSEPSRFNGIFIDKNKIITMINSADLSSTTKDMDLENVWDYYVIDIETKTAKKIEGLKSCTGFILGANLVSKVDDKYYIRYVRTGDDQPYNGYYEYDFETNKATPVFNVIEGGYVLDLKKITIK